MDKKPETSQEKKFVSKSRSCNNEPVKLKTEPTKRKSFNLNDAVKSLDLALGRLKKSKLVNGDSPGGLQGFGPATGALDMSGANVPYAPGVDNASLMSMNFSHYELMRNLSCSTSNSESTFSGTTCAYSADNSLKNEHIEKFFRSAEMWTRKSSPNSVRFDVLEK